MKGMFGLHGLLLVFAIQAAIKCQATFCSDRYINLQQELIDHCMRCITGPAVNSECCEAEKSSLEERKKNHRILCGELYNKIYLL